ncbi:putative aminotransferase class-III [Colletotrichum tabaci]|uniref:Aminotransferase class-III n=1 Tax=Colletotrichum tabaci TaxID=1209068 RepID=A0AAV9TDY2_9PEZI
MLIQGTGGAMSKAYFMCSGSEAMESAMKLARQYYMELSPQQPKRVNFIAREGSYHGTTLGSLSMSGHVARRSLFLDLLLPNIARVSACNAYRGMTEGQTTEEYVAQLADELDRKFQELGPDTVCAFVAEPVVGAALGCVPAVPGYFKAMKTVCDKYGALLILDEVMSGMGRSGTLHAWQHEDVIPDIQTIAKGLGGGYAPMAGMLINHRIAKVLGDGTGTFSHGHTYQGHPVGCAAALEVQRIIQEEELVSNVRKQGVLLEKLLREHLGDHPYVGNIRGKGLFWGPNHRRRNGNEPDPKHRIDAIIRPVLFLVVLASLTEKYIDYINDTSHIAVPSSDPLSDDHFIEFQRLGPFELTHMDNMQALSTIMLALAIQQLRATDNGRALKRCIEAVVAAGPGRR